MQYGSCVILKIHMEEYMSESEQIVRLKSEIEQLKLERDMWKRSSQQLLETINKLIASFITGADKL